MAFQFSSIQRFLSKLPGFSRPDKHPLAFLNVAQFTGVINDNIYKLALIFFLIELQGTEKASIILSSAGAIFVIPFLLFSPIAGSIADRFSKSRIITLLKAIEIILFFFITLSFAFKVAWAGYLLLFFLSTHSALFGPPKYGILPELVPKNQVSKANGLITSFTYLAIILGTFLASFITKISNHNFVAVACFSLFTAIVGFISAFGIRYTPPRGTKEGFSFAYFRMIFDTLKACKQERHLLVAISGSAYFLFVGAYTQLNIIPFAIEALGLSDVAGGFLFLSTAFGIAFGAFLAGRASKNLIELGLSCISGILICFLFITLAGSSGKLALATVVLFVLGFFGGCFVVPFDTFIQIFSPEKTRGHVIAVSNFLSFCGVLLSSFAIYLFNDLFGLSAAGSFIVMGLVTLAFSFFLTFRLSDLFFSYLSRKVLMRLIKINPVDLASFQSSKTPVLVIEEATFFKAWILWGFVPTMHLLIPSKDHKLPFMLRMWYSIHRIPPQDKFEVLLDQGQSYTKSGAVPCLYLKQKIPARAQSFFLIDLFKRKSYDRFVVNFTRTNWRTYSVQFSIIK